MWSTLLKGIKLHCDLITIITLRTRAVVFLKFSATLVLISYELKSLMNVKAGAIIAHHNHWNWNWNCSDHRSFLPGSKIDSFFKPIPRPSSPVEIVTNRGNIEDGPPKKKRKAAQCYHFISGLASNVYVARTRRQQRWQKSAQVSIKHCQILAFPAFLIHSNILSHPPCYFMIDPITDFINDTSKSNSVVISLYINPMSRQKPSFRFCVENYNELKQYDSRNHPIPCTCSR